MKLYTKYEARFNPDAKYLFIGLGVSALLELIALLMAHLSVVTRGDIPVYGFWAQAVAHGRVPYKTVRILYPPGALPFILVPQLLHFISNYSAVYLLLTTLAIAWYVSDRLKQGVREMALAILILLPLLPFVYMELDVFAGLLLYLALKYFKPRPYLAGILIGISALIKLYPAAVVVVLVWLIPKRKRLRFIAVFLGTVMVGLLPFLVIAPGGLIRAISQQSGRLIEFESSGALVGYIEKVIHGSVSMGFSVLGISLNFKGEELVGLLTTLLLAVSLISASVLVYMHRLKPKTIPLSLLALIIFVLFYKVGSPQYLVVPLMLLPLAKAQMPLKAFISLLKRMLVLSVIVWLQFLSRYSISPFASLAGWRGWTALILSIARLILLLGLTRFLYRFLRARRGPNIIADESYSNGAKRALKAE